MKRIRLNKLISLLISFAMVLTLFPSYSLGAANNLTINYKYENGDTAAEAYSASVDVDTPYSVDSPTISGYKPDQATVSGTMPAEDVELTVVYHPTYTLTIRYQYEDGTDASAQYTDTLVAGDPYTVDSPTVTGFKPDQATVSGTMPAENVEVTVVYHTAYTLTIRYQNVDGSEASAPHTDALVAGETYSVASPTITGYKPDQATVSGTMPAENTEVIVVYHPTYTLTIHYLYLDSSLPLYPVAAPTYTGEFLPGEGYDVASPVITHYFASQNSVAGTMANANVDVTVTYVSYHVHINVHYKQGGSSPIVQQFDKYVDYSTLSTYYIGSNIGLVNNLWSQTGQTLGWKTSSAYEPRDLVSNGSTGLSPTVSSSAYNYTVDVYLQSPPKNTSYTVTYDANGGTGTMTDTHSPYSVGNSGTTFTVLNNSFTPPTGKHFIGWNTQADGFGTSYVAGTTYSIIGNVVLYAQWEYDAQYSVTYNANGGSGSVPTGGSSYHTGNVVTVLFTPAPTRSGYNFLGWATSSGATTATYTASGLKSFTMGTANVTLYAVWQAINYSVSYNANGGSGSVPTGGSTNHTGDLITVLFTPAPTRNGYNFLGWATSSGATTATYTASGTKTFTMGAANVTLYAVWQVINYTVSYNANGGSGTMTDTSNPYHYGDLFRVRTNTFTAPTNKHFTGWNSAADGSGTNYNAGTSYSISGNVTLYAQWAFNAQYTVSYYANGGTGTMTDTSSPYYANNSFTVLENTFTAPANMHFTGWDTDPNGYGTNYNEGSSYTITGNVKLYAQWDWNEQYWVIYDANGGWGWTYDWSNPYFDGTSVTVLDNGFYAPTNKHFVGWNTTRNGSGTSYAAGSSLTVTDDITLYAQWANNTQYTVSYNANGGSGTMTDPLSPYINVTSFTALSNAFTAPTHKHFAGWNSAANGSGTSYTAGSSYTLSGNVTLYAQWEYDDTYTVSYNANGGTGSMYDTFNPYYDGDSFTVMVNAFTAPTNKHFASWNTAADGSGVTYAAGSLNVIHANVTLYAQWEYNDQFTVTYDENGGTGTMTDTSSPYYDGNLFTVLTNAFTAPTNKHFIGFNTAADGSGTSYTEGSSYAISANVTLYAQWEYNEQFTVSYNENGGTGTMTDTSSPYYDGNLFTVLTNAFTAPTNKHFAGFNTAADGSGTSYTEGSSYAISANVTLYAQWEYNEQFTVTYDENGGTGTMTDTSSPYYDGNLFTVLTNAFTAPTNKHFIGWNDAADGSGTSYTEGSSYAISANVTLYAQWEFNEQFTVSYDENGGTGTMTDTSSPYYDGNLFTVLTNAFTAPTNKHFVGFTPRQTAAERAIRRVPLTQSART